MNSADDILFTRQLWLQILDTEEMIRNHYLKLVDATLYDTYDDTPPAQQPLNIVDDAPIPF